jgi:hypothetical protein
MSIWINIVYGIVPHVRVAIVILRVGGVGDERVRAEEAS